MSSKKCSKVQNNLVAKHSRHCRGGAHKDKRRASRLIRNKPKEANEWGLY